MDKRTKIGQKKHDSAVLKTAQWYENNGYKVKADLPDYNKPKKIGGFIPDLIVKKAKIEKVIEIETKKSNKTDQEQQTAFKQYAKTNGAEFKKKVI